MWLLLLAVPLPAAAWDAQRLPSALVIQGLMVPHPVFAIYPLPGDVIRVRWKDGSPGRVRYLGREHATGSGTVHAPRRPGLTHMEVAHAGNGTVARIAVLTRVPYGEMDGAGLLRGYLIGHYPDQPLRGQEIYLPPRGFVEVPYGRIGPKIDFQPVTC